MRPRFWPKIKKLAKKLEAKIGLFSRQKLKKFPLRGTRVVAIPLILTALTNTSIFLLGCQKISTYIEINVF